jgi:predicted RNA-binding protein YlxR (DUF448 family)
VKPVDDMIRFVLDPGGTVVADLKRKLPGRGVWVTAERQAVQTAASRGAFARSLKRPARVPADLPLVVEGLIERSALDALGIAYKAGLVAVGFAKVEAALQHGGAIAVLQARGAAPDGVRKLAAAARRGQSEGAEGLPTLTFAEAQLDLALGRANVIHAALLAGPASEALLARYRRLERYRGRGPARRAE